MSTFLERLKDEKEQLFDKASKLENYINTNDHFNTLSDANKALLMHQLYHMKEYLNTLVIRIELNDK